MNNKTLKQLFSLIIVFLLAITFVSVFADNSNAGQAAAPAAGQRPAPTTQPRVVQPAQPQASQAEPAGPSVPRQPRSSSQTRAVTAQKKWSATTWAAVIIGLLAAIAFIILLVVYNKRKKKEGDDLSKLSKIMRITLIVMPPITYLILLIVVLSAGTYIHDIDALIIKFSEKRGIAYYGVIYALGFVITYFYMRSRIKQKKLNFTVEQLDSFFIYGCIGVVLGARVFEALFYVTPWYNFFWWKDGFKSFSNGWTFVKIWNGGLSAHGGIVGATVAVAIFCRKKGKSFYEIMDSVVIPVAIAFFLGRIANYINGELKGVVTSGDWGVFFKGTTGATNEPRIPTQLYESFKNLLSFSILVLVRPKLKKPGMLAWTWVFLYGVFRFIIEFWKDYSVLWKIGELNFTMGHILCLAMIGMSSFFLFNLARKDSGKSLTILTAEQKKKRPISSKKKKKSKKKSK